MRLSLARTMLIAACALVAAGAAPPPNAEPEARAPTAKAADGSAAQAADSSAAILAEGWKELRYANWPKAQGLFEQVRGESGDPRQRAEATFALGNLLQFRRPGPKVAQAVELYEQVLAEYADAPVAPFAVMALARQADTPDLEKDRDPKRARELYERLLRDWPEHILTDEAVLRLALLSIQEAYIPDTAVWGDMWIARFPLAERDRLETEAARRLEEHLKKRPGGILAAPMHVTLGNLYERRGRWQEAVNAWIAADAAGIPGLGDRATLYHRIARVAELKLGQYDVAARWYERIVTDIRRDARYYVALLAAERCRAKAPSAPAPSAAGDDASAPASAGEGGR